MSAGRRDEDGAGAARPEGREAPADVAGACRLVLLGDLHLYRLAVAPWRLVGKRLAGQLNLWLCRRHRFDRGLLHPLLERVRALDPDALLLSGDLTTTALPAEFADVGRALGPLRDGRRVVAVPGNHDRYTFSAAWRRTAEACVPGLYPASFPAQVRLAAGWHLVALDAAVPRVASSRGRVGRRQRAQAESLDIPGGAGLVVLCHYPFAVPDGVHWPRSHRLADAGPVASLVGRWSARFAQVLYLHGHVHRPWRWRPATGVANVQALNAGAPCHRSPAYPGGQGFWELELPADPVEPVGLRHHVRDRHGRWVSGDGPGCGT